MSFIPHCCRCANDTLLGYLSGCTARSIVAHRSNYYRLLVAWTGNEIELLDVGYLRMGLSTPCCSKLIDFSIT